MPKLFVQTNLDTGALTAGQLQAIGKAGVESFDLSENADMAEVFQAAAAKTFGGGTVLLPPGNYWITDTVDWGSARVLGAGAGPNPGSTRINVRADVIGFKVSGSYGELADMHFDGRVDGENTGGIGASTGTAAGTAGPHKPRFTRLTSYWFKFAGFAIHGAQNALFTDCFAQLNLYNFAVCNASGNVQFLNCNAADSPTEFNAWMTANTPNCRNILVGNPANAYFTSPTPSGHNTPFYITWQAGIYERSERHTYNIELLNGWGRHTFSDMLLSGGGDAIIRIGEGFLTAPGVVEFRNLGAGSNAVNTPILSNPGNVPVIIDRNFRPSASYAITDYHRRPIYTGDYGAFIQTVDAPGIFTHGIGNWVDNNGAVSFDAANKRLVVAATALNQRVQVGPGLNSPIRIAGGQTLSPHANQVIKVKWYCTDLAQNGWTIKALRATSPFEGDIATITATGEGEATYLCTADEIGSIRLTNTFNGPNEAKFAYFFVTTF